MATGTLVPVGRRQFFHPTTGAPLNGGKVYYYLAGLATLATVYQDADLTTPHPNPVVLDSAGMATIFLAPGTVDEQVRTSDGTLLYTTSGIKTLAAYTIDDTIDGVAGENLAQGSPVFLSDGTGGRTAGRWYLTDADTAAMSSTATLVGLVMSTSILIGASGSIRIGGRATGLSGLTAGALYYCSTTAGALTTTPPTNERLIGQADSTTSLVMVPQFAVVPASRVTAGTFGAGGYTFPSTVVVTGAATLSSTLGVAGVTSLAGNTIIGGGVAGGRVTINQASNGSGLALYIQTLTRTGTERVLELSGSAAGLETYSLAAGHWNVGAAGTEALPALTLNSDSDTGARLKAANSWGFSANGAEVASFGAGFWAFAAALFGTAVISPTALTANTTTSNWAPTGFSTALVIRADISDVFDPATLDGLAGGTAGRIIFFVNIGTSNPIRLLNEGSLSTAANRFMCGEISNTSYVAIAPNTGVLLWYDGTSSRWRVFGGDTLVG